MYNYIIKKPKIRKTILKQTKKDNNVIYGARAVMAQAHPVTRRLTEDYDIYSKTPRRSAKKLECSLDKQFGRDQFYVKEAMHKGTWKVMDRGLKKSVKDDAGIVDYSKPDRKVRTVVRNGIRYVHITETKKDKKRSLKDPQSAFRHKKDQRDLDIINTSSGLNKIMKRRIRI